MKTTTALFIFTLILSSCCSPHFVGYVNPLDLEEVGWEETCPLTPCKGDEPCPGALIPWINLEYERSNNNIAKIGASYLGYTDKTILSLTGNYLTNFNFNHSGKLIHGLDLDAQLGMIPINNYYTNIYWY